MSTRFIDNLPISDALKAKALKFHFHWINETGKPANVTRGFNIQATDTLDSCPALNVDIMGAHLTPYNPNEAELAFIRKTFDECTAFLTICAGMMAPLAAGVSEGKTATAPRFMIEGLRYDAPGTHRLERRWGHDSKLWSNGTLLIGLDMMRPFAEEIWGGEMNLADSVLADWLVVYQRR